MSNSEVSPLSDAQERAYPAWYKADGLSGDEKLRRVITRLAAVLTDPENQVLLDNIYEGSSFTDVMGDKLGFEVVDDPENPHQHESLTPVIAGIKALQTKGAIKYEKHPYPFTDAETANSAGGSPAEYKVEQWLIHVIPDPKKLGKLLPDSPELS